jgi:hypothetical protein
VAVTLCGLVPSLVWLPLYLNPGWVRPGVIAAHLITIVAGSLLMAWSWATAVAIMEGARAGSPIGVPAALRAGLRGVGRLWAWLLLLQALSLSYLLLYLDAEAFIRYERSPLSTIVECLDWYIAFATALLPLAVLLERRGIARAWQLTHTNWRIAARVMALLALGFVVDELLDMLKPLTIDMLDTLELLTTEVIISLLVSIPLSVLTMVSFYETYPALPDHPTPAGEPSSPAVGSASQSSSSEA